MNRFEIYNVTDVPYVYRIGEKTLLIRIEKGDMDKCLVHCKDRYDLENTAEDKEMLLADSKDLFYNYEAELRVEEQRYRICLSFTEKNNEAIFLNERDLTKNLRNRWSRKLFKLQLKFYDIYNSSALAQEGQPSQITNTILVITMLLIKPFGIQKRQGANKQVS